MILTRGMLCVWHAFSGGSLGCTVDGCALGQCCRFAVYDRLPVNVIRLGSGVDLMGPTSLYSTICWTVLCTVWGVIALWRWDAEGHVVCGDLWGYTVGLMGCDTRYELQYCLIPPVCTLCMWVYVHVYDVYDVCCDCSHSCAYTHTYIYICR